MVEFFICRPTEEEAITFCLRLFREAVIEPICSAGRYERFAIRINQPSLKVRAHLRHARARCMFFILIDLRIRHQAYQPPTEKLAYIDWPAQDDGSRTAHRIA